MLSLGMNSSASIELSLSCRGACVRRVSERLLGLGAGEVQRTNATHLRT